MPRWQRVISDALKDDVQSDVTVAKAGIQSDLVIAIAKLDKIISDLVIIASDVNN